MVPQFWMTLEPSWSILDGKGCMKCMIWPRYIDCSIGRVDRSRPCLSAWGMSHHMVARRLPLNEPPWHRRKPRGSKLGNVPTRSYQPARQSQPARLRLRCRS